MSFDKGRDTAEALKEKAISEMSALELERKRVELMERQIALQESQAASLMTQVERTAPKDNPNYIAAGPFTDPKGNPWSKSLKCPIFDGPIDLMESETLTEDEVTQLNRLLPLERGLIKKADDSIVGAKVLPTFDAHGKITKLVIMRPMGKDDGAQHYPPLREMARQLADQAAQVSA